MSLTLTIDNLGWFADVVRAAKERACTDLYLLEKRPVRLGLLKGYFPLEPTIIPTKEQIEELRDSTMPPLILSKVGDAGREGRAENVYDRLMRQGGVEYCFTVRDYGRFRVSLSRSEEGVGMSIRKLPFFIPDFDSLNPNGYLDGIKAILNFHTRVPQGLILHAGITGSGKTTLIASEVDMVAGRSNGSILTFENPIEYLYTYRKALIRQYEVGRHVDSYVHALKMSLRNDPSVLVLGEVRTKEEIHALVDTAMRGHLVFSTVHTSSAINTLRFLDGMGAELDTGSSGSTSWRQMLANSVLAIVAQKLVYKEEQGFFIVPEVLVADNVIRNKILAGEFREIETMMNSNSMRGSGSMSLGTVLHDLENRKVITDRQRRELGSGTLSDGK